MRIFSVLAAALLFGTVAVMGQTAPLRWAEGAPNATSDMKDNVKVEGFKTDDIHIYVSLNGVEQTEYNRVWVQVANHSKAPVDFDPQMAILLTDKDKTVRAEVPEKAANSIQKFGEAKSQELSSAHCTMMTATGCQPTNAQMQMSKQVLAFSGQQAEWVRQNGMKKKTLAPGEEEQGAIVFKKDKKPGNYILRVVVGAQTFEFPLSTQNKAPSYD
jgi:hypothetical protein